MVYHVTWTTHKADGINPARQVTEDFTDISTQGLFRWPHHVEGLGARRTAQKADWLSKNGISYTITQEDNNLAV